MIIDKNSRTVHARKAGQVLFSFNFDFFSLKHLKSTLRGHSIYAFDITIVLASRE